MINMLTSNQ